MSEAVHVVGGDAVYIILQRRYCIVSLDGIDDIFMGF